MKTYRAMLWFATAAAAVGLGSQAFGQADEDKGPPLPFITIEGQGGGAFTPMAYLVNPAPECQVWGKPAVAFDYIGLGRKNLESMMVTENILGRIELGFAANRFGLGTLPTDINTAFNDPGLINNSDVWLYHFSARALVIKENRNDVRWMPAVTVGLDYKYNADIGAINDKLGGALTTIGYDRNDSVDFTLTATKTMGTAFFGRPLIVTAGLRESQAANLGYLGFGDTYAASFEGNIAVLPFDKLLFAYEYRQKSSPYGTIGPGGTIDAPLALIGDEADWHGFDVAYIASKHTTIVGGYGIFGNLANTKADNAWWLQLKYEF